MDKFHEKKFQESQRLNQEVENMNRIFTNVKRNNNLKTKQNKQKTQFP